MAGGPTPFSAAFGVPLQGQYLYYNTSSAGTPLPIVYGTTRCSVNLGEYWGFTGSAGGIKGGKGGGPPGTENNAQSGGKKGSNQQYAVDVAFMICQGPVSFMGAPAGFSGNNRVWSNGGIAGINNSALNTYDGNDGQMPDPTFESSSPNQPVIGYSGTCYVTGTPMQLGSSPALPDISFEITGFLAGSNGPNQPGYANPSLIIQDMLSNQRYGAGFPAANLDTAGSLADYQNYCQAAQLGMSPAIDRSQPAARWVEEFAELTVAAVCCSGPLLKIIPYGDQALSANGTSWAPNLTWQYSLDEGDILREATGGDNASDPVIVPRNDPSNITNFMTLEYLDVNNSYNVATVPAFDQGLIDQFGLRNEASKTAHEFTDQATAQTSAQLLLQRKAYIRNTYKFKVGSRFARLDLMDIVLVNDSYLGLSAAPVRITGVDEDDNGGLAITAEEIPGLTP